MAYLLAAILGFAIAQFLAIIRWYLLVRAQQLPFAFVEALRLGTLGIFLNTFLPGSVGGDIMKAGALAARQRRRTVAVATVVMDRVIALWGLIWFVALLGSVFWVTGTLDGLGSAQAKLIVIAAALTVGTSAVAWILLGFMSQRSADRLAAGLSRLPGLGAQAGEFWRAVWLYRCRQASMALAVLLSW